MGPRARRWTWAACTLLCAAGAAAELRFEPCELRGSSGHGRVQAECAELGVAENPDTGGSRSIALRVARIPAPAGAAEAAPLTLINGGPGASSIDLYVDIEPALSGIRRHRDIIVVDQRGTGASGRLDCPALQAESGAFDAERVRAAAAACLEEIDADPRYYTTSVAVRDLEAVRAALGVAAWHVYGVSYGTRVAAHYARKYPQAVSSLILDGVLPPQIVLGPEVAPNAQHTLDGILRRCGETPSCARAFPDIVDDLAALFVRLRAAPVEVSLLHPVTGRPHRMILRDQHLAMTLRMSSYAPETAALIPLLVHEAAREENFTPVAAQALRLERSLMDAISFGMHNSVVCSEDAPRFGDLDALRPQLDATYLGADQMRALALICEQWPAGPVDDDLAAPLSSALPTLLLSGEHDPITPPRYADLLAAGLDHGRHLVAPGQGHGVIARGCMAEIIEDFLAAGSADDLDAACLDRLAADPFFVDPLGPPP